MSRARELARTAVWLLPASTAKNRLLRMLGHDIHPTAVAHPCLVSKVASFTMEGGSSIGKGNLLKHLREVHIGEQAAVGRLNVISSHPVYRRLYPDGAALVVGNHSFITSRHQLDCSGSLRVGQFSAMAGHGTKVVSHSIDVRLDAQAAYPVVIGDRSFVGARCLILGGAVLPGRSVLAAGSVLPRSKAEREPGLWAGVPAAHRGQVDGAWFSRQRTGTSRVYIPASGETVEDAL